MSDIAYVESGDHLSAKQVEWRVAVGRFILGFGGVEWFTKHMLAELPSEGILESTISLPFGRRLDIVTQLIEEKGFEDDLVGDAKELIRRARKLAEDRNVVAHNPLILNLFDDSAGIDLKYQISKYGDTEPRMTIERLHELCRDVEDLDAELGNLRERIEVAMTNL